MSYNYDSLLCQMTPRKKTRSNDALAVRQGMFSSVQLFFAASVFSLFGAANAYAQTTIINPATNGGFNSGNTFAANGWTAANEGTGSSKWAVGTAASGNVSVATTQLTTTSIEANTYSVILAAENPSISVGMLITAPGFVGANTYVASINGTTLGLSKASLNNNALVTAQSLSFAATSSAISGNAAYISNDNGTSYTASPEERTVYFYRDITNIPLSEKAMTLTFDVKSDAPYSSGWQVWVAPISQTVIGKDTQVTSPMNHGVSWPGATLISFNSDPQVAVTKNTAFIPMSFAGTPFRLIFVWTRSEWAPTVPPAAIDNISLISRVGGEEIACAHSGLWSQPSTWVGGTVPSPADIVVLDGIGETVMIDSKYSGCQDLFFSGANTLMQFASSNVVDEFTVYNDFTLNATGSRFNNHDGSTGKWLKVGQDINVAANARFDSSRGGNGDYQGRLTLNGSKVQNVNVNPTGFIGGSAPGKNGYGNLAGVLNQLEVTNTSKDSPNVKWDANGVRINSQLLLPTGRVSVLGANRLIIGNFTSYVGTMNIPAGYGFTSGTISRWIDGNSNAVVQPGTEYPGLDNNYKSFWYPFASVTGFNRSLYLLPDSSPATAGEVAVTYTDASTAANGLSITDGSYTINKRCDGKWAFSTPEGKADSNAESVVYAPNETTPTHRLGIYANGAYEAIDGTSRLMNFSTALPGTHQDGTAQPFAFRKGLTLANLTALPVYVGVNNASALTTENNFTSKASGDWNTGSTWFGGVVPTCSNVVTIAPTHNVTVSTAANAAGVIIKQGATLINNAGATTMTVGSCANNSNNAAFYNYGTHTMTAGSLKVNGFVAHKTGSFFNQTSGEIIIDSNNNGDAATSVAFGGASCKIETSNLGLTGGKITIVDPLVNIGTPVSASSIGNYTLKTLGVTGTFTLNGSITGTTAEMGGVANIFEVGQVISGHANIPAGTTITAVTLAGWFFPEVTLTLSAPVTAAVPAGTPLQFSSMSNGCPAIVLEANATNANLAVGTGVSGPGIQAGSVITKLEIENYDPTGLTKVTLSKPVTGLVPSPIASQQTVTFSAVSVGSNATALTAANPNIITGMTVSGAGIKLGTFVVDISDAKLTLSEPIQAGAPSPLVMNFHAFNTQSSGSFIYNSSVDYAAGLNHTLQIGDGVSNQNTTLVTNGFNCQFQALGGLFSVGNLTVNAPDGNNRFMNVSSNNSNGAFNMNVQNAFTVTTGSVFKKTFANSTVYVGGNIVNNGTINFPTGGTTLCLGNVVNDVAVPTTLAQTISGSGSWVANQYGSGGPTTGYALGSLTINNTNPAGVTLQVPNFKVSGSVNLTNGIFHTSAAYPIYCGIEDVTGTSFYGGSYFAENGGSKTYIDGPCFHANRFDSFAGQYKLFPVGKNGKYLPIQIASTGGVVLMAEAFDTNSGTVNPSLPGLSAARWKVTRVGTAGNFTGYNVKLGSSPDVTDSSIIVHATTDQGAYNVVSTPASVTSYELVGYGNTPNKPAIFLGTPQTGGFLGNFAYTVTPPCTGTPAPTGAATQNTCSTGTIADFTVTGAAGATFTWYDDATLDNAIPTTTIAVVDATYYVSQTANGCEGPRLAIKSAGPCLGTDDLKIAELNYYPNPVSNQLTITAKDAITRVELYNLLGQQLRVFDVNSDNIQIDFDIYTPSAYLIKVYSENKVQFFKVIKK